MQVGQFTDNARCPIIALDFDGTMNMENCYPECGVVRPYASLITEYLESHGVKVVMWTCRDDDNSLGLMADFLEENNIVHHSVNASAQFAPFDYESRKIYAHMYVDDRGFGWVESETILLSVYREFMTKYTGVPSNRIDDDIAAMILKHTNNKDFDISHLMEEYTIYTDGGCWNGNGMGAWAYIVLEDRVKSDKIIRSDSGKLVDSTNNRAELMAVIEGIKSLPKGSKVNIFTDSGYVQHGFTKPNYLNKWMNNGWKLSNKKPVKNIDLWKILIGLSTMYNINMTLVRGHEKDPIPINRHWNTICDKMCTARMEEFKLAGLVNHF